MSSWRNRMSLQKQQIFNSFPPNPRELKNHYMKTKDIESMFNCMYVSEEESIDAMNRLGLILTNE